MAETMSRMADLHLDGWEGRTRQTVCVVGETPTRYRIRAIDRTRLAGPRWLDPGATALVPKYAITFISVSPGRTEESQK